MNRYKGMTAILYRVLFVIALAVGAFYLHGEGYSMYTQIGNLKTHMDNKQKIEDNKISINNYNSAKTELDKILKYVKSFNTITDEDRENFLGYVGQCVKKSNVGIKNVTFVNINKYVKDNMINLGEMSKKEREALPYYNQVTKENMIKNSVGERYIEGAEEAMEEDNKKSRGRKKRAGKAEQIDGILIDITGKENVYNFVRTVEFYNFKYFVSSFENKSGEETELRLILDLR